MAMKIVVGIFRFPTWGKFYTSHNLLESFEPFSSKSRLYAAQVKKPENQAPVYKGTDHEYKTTKKASVQTLEHLLNIKTLNAIAIVSTNKVFQKTSSATFKANYALYVQKSISHDTIVKYPEILTVTDSEKKLQELQKLPYDINTVAVLLMIPLHILIKFVTSELEGGKARSKISVMSSLLQIDDEKSCKCIAEKTFLCSFSVDKMEKNIKTLTEFGVNPQDICNDLWVLKYSEETIKNRLSIAREHNIDTVKTWMVRAQEEHFQNYIQRRSDNKSILGNGSLAEYLAERLECSVEIANYIILKQPALQNKSLKKLKLLIDFLYAEGFKSVHIWRVPKILVHSVETTRKRLQQLEQKGIKIDSLSILTKSQNQFTQCYEALIKSKTKLKSKT